MVGTAHERFCREERLCQRLCPPYGVLRAGRAQSVAPHTFTYSVVKQPVAFGESIRTKGKSSPVCGSGPGGRPYFLSSVSLEIEGDGAPTRRSARITPGGLSGLLRTMGALLVHPRLAAHQRGIFAFRPLTVV